MGTGNNARIFILLGLLFAVVTLISSEVSAAKDLAAKTTKDETAKKSGLQDAKYGGNGGYSGNDYDGYPILCEHGCCDRRGYYRRDCYNCCYSAAQAKAFAAETTATPNNLKP
ncbi:hypothetical protein MKW92_031718 [Papaver armeniacum]|nr:hypothetical protein MKW92_031718 [Papaver armeniacum]